MISGAERLRGRLHADALLRTFPATVADAYEAIVEVRLAEGRVDEAFALSDVSRSRALTEAGVPMAGDYSSTEQREADAELSAVYDRLLSVDGSVSLALRHDLDERAVRLEQRLGRLELGDLHAIDRRRDPPGRLELDGVGVEGAFSDVTATAEAGRITAIVGPTGAGKSTLLAVVAQMVEPDTGRVLLDGQDLAAVARDDVRAVIGIVAADLPLLRGTLRANLTYRCPDADAGDVAAIVAHCELGELVASLPGGLDSRLNEGGRDLSSGQRQRVLLARAVLGAPRVLLLDEADANLDPATTAVVDRVLRRYAGTALVVTHRRERLAVADAIWHLDSGRLVEAGPSHVVLAAGGPTAQLFGGVEVGADAR